MSEKLKARIISPGAKKILALDGGGIRGMITVEVLAEIENLLLKKTGRGKNFRLADYFDFVAGTSTGAIIAACISVGMSMCVCDVHCTKMHAHTRACGFALHAAR